MWTKECGDSNPHQQPLKVRRFEGSKVPKWSPMRRNEQSRKKIQYLLIQMGSEPVAVAEWSKVGQTLKKILMMLQEAHSLK